MIWLFPLHALAAVAAAVAGRRYGPRATFAVAATAPATTLAWACIVTPGVLDGDVLQDRYSWARGLELSVELRLDAFSLLMVALIAGVGVLICWYSGWYFPQRHDLGGLAGLLVAFAGAMVGIVLADNLLLVYVFWELTSITSYLLIGFEDREATARSAALQALLVTGAGGLAMLGGFVLLGQAAGTYSLSGILARPPSGGLVVPALVLVLAGAFTKSAQVPFHFWLPGAMAAPTPVSAYLHSATMVKAGVYLIARLAPAFADGWDLWRPLVVGVGVLTMLVGGWQALRQYDLKLLLAHGTVSQLGFMTALVGVGRPELTLAGVAVLLAHGLFKAALFLTVGIVDHQAHTRDIRRLAGVGRSMPAVLAVAAVAAASMAGVFPLLGFVTKEAAFEALLHDGAGLLVTGGIVVGSALTVAYGARFLWGGFADKPPGTDTLGSSQLPGPALGFLAPALLLSGLTVFLGLAPALASELVGPAATALDPSADPSTLSLWHGLTWPLALSVLALAAGGLAFGLRSRLERLQRRLGIIPAATSMYRAVLSGVLKTADRVTALLQNGSLPIYLAVILVTMLVLPGAPLLSDLRIGSEAVFAESPLQVVVALLAAVAAVATARSARRFAAVLCLGGVGFAVAVLFVLQGAPDLALTQLLIETLSLVIFVLVLRHLPERFVPHPWKLRRAARLALAAGVGAFVTVFALVAASARTADPVSEAQLERALPEGGGKNVVNVILVDFRGFDTLGEITVLAVAALGIASLVLAGRREPEQ